MFDTIIRGGSIIDGRGGPAFRADVAIRDGLIVEVGRIDGPAHEEIDAGGAIVTPGFIDIHTHYDGQFIWDDVLEPSFSNGVTTAIAGNCGVGFAPVREQDRAALIDIMEGVEDIPGIVIEEGLDWAWESFPDYLDRLSSRAFTMDVATHVAHAPIRVYVMGDRALRDEAATSDDIERMRDLVREAMDAGAVGFSCARIEEHKTIEGGSVPGTHAADPELLGIAAAMGEKGTGVFQLVPLGAAGANYGPAPTTEERLEEHDRIVSIARASGRPVTYALHAHDHAPDEWRLMVARTHEAREQGFNIRVQVPPRGLGTLLSLDGYNLFRMRPSYRAIENLPLAERAAAMRDPARRAAILSEPDSDGRGLDVRSQRVLPLFTAALPRCFVMRLPLDYEPDERSRIDCIAAASGRTASEVYYDTLAEGDGSNMVVDFAMHYTNDNLDAAREMLADPVTISGLSDGGAHLPMICDAAAPTFHLWFWARDRKRGPRLPLELMVHRLTGDPAALYGFDDRGIIAPGKRADINVIDFAMLGNEMPRITFDLPSGGRRLVQAGHGYRATMVHGVVTRRDDRDTGARPGRLVRARRDAHVSSEHRLATV